MATHAEASLKPISCASMPTSVAAFPLRILASVARPTPDAAADVQEGGRRPAAPRAGAPRREKVSLLKRCPFRSATCALVSSSQVTAATCSNVRRRALPARRRFGRCCCGCSSPSSSRSPSLPGGAAAAGSRTRRSALLACAPWTQRGHVYRHTQRGHSFTYESSTNSPEHLQLCKNELIKIFAKSSGKIFAKIEWKDTSKTPQEE